MADISVYMETDLFCIAVLVVLILNGLKNRNREVTHVLFLRLMAACIVFFLGDLLWYLAECLQTAEHIGLHKAVNVFYFVSSVIFPYCWFLYAESVQNPRATEHFRFRLLTAIPLMIVSALAVVSPFTGWLFYIDPENAYHRGPLYIIEPLCTYGYSLVASIKALVNAFKKENYVNREKYLMLSTFCIVPLVFGTIQMIFINFPLLSMGTTLVMLAIYVDMQDQMISLDHLTQLNNRHQLLEHLEHKMNNRSSKKLYLLMMDMDLFKKINDQYGHVEGDHALVLVAGVLKRIAGIHNLFVARFGGDEFILVGELRSDAEAEEIGVELNDLLAAKNTEQGNPYVLRMSVGYAVYTEEIDSIPAFIAAADERLYAVKKARKELYENQ